MSMNGWIEKELGDILTLNYGWSLPEKKRIAGEVPVYGSNGVVGNHNHPLVNSVGLIVGRKGSAGNVHYSRKPFCPIDTTFFIAPSDTSLDLEFLYFLLLHINLKRILGDVGVPGLNREMAYKEITTFPVTKDEQQKIAAVLGLAQQAIEQQERLIALTAELKKTLLCRFFIEGFHGADEVPVPEALVKFKIERQRQLPSAQIKEQGRWPVVDQGQSFISGYTDDDGKVISNGLPLIIFGDHTRCVKFVDFPFILGADGTKVLKADETKFRPRFLYYAIAALEIPNRGYNRHFIILKEKRIKQPDFDAQDIAVEQFVSLDKALSVHQRKHAALTDLFRTLLHHLMTAQIRVNELDLSKLSEPSAIRKG